MKRFLVLALLSLALFESCNTPALNGESFAKKEYKAYVKCNEKLDELQKSFTSNFDPGKYASRSEAQKDWQSRRSAIVRDLKSDCDAINDEYEMVMYGLGPQDRLKMEQSYRSERNLSYISEVASRVADTTIPQQVLKSISRINPLKPDENRIRDDFASRTISDVEGGYFDVANQKIDVEEYNIKECRIIEVVNESAEEQLFIVYMRLEGKVNADRQFDVKCKVRYVLPPYDDWRLDFQNTEELTPISCDVYKDCIMFDGRWDLYVKNKCDKSLQVFIKFYSYGHWYKKTVVAKSQDMTFVCLSKPDECKIEYILPL